MNDTQLLAITAAIMHSMALVAVGTGQLARRINQSQEDFQAEIRSTCLKSAKALIDDAARIA